MEPQAGGIYYLVPSHFNFFPSCYTFSMPDPDKSLTARQEAALPIDFDGAILGMDISTKSVDEALALTVRTAAQDARSSHQAIRVLRRFRFRDIPDGKGGMLKKTPWRNNSSSYEQVLLMLREEMEAIEEAELVDGESELERHAKKVMTLKAMAEYTLNIQKAVNHTIDRSAKLEIEGRKLEFLKQKHADERKDRGFDAKDVEAIADG